MTQRDELLKVISNNCIHLHLEDKKVLHVDFDNFLVVWFERDFCVCSA